MRLLQWLAPGEIKASRKLNLEPPTSLAIASNQVTISQSWHKLVATAGAQNRRLEIINGGETGDVLILQRDPSSTEIALVVDGAGNILSAGNFGMDSNRDSITLLFDGANWIELSRSNS